MIRTVLLIVSAFCTSLASSLSIHSYVMLSLWCICYTKPLANMWTNALLQQLKTYWACSIAIQEEKVCCLWLPVSLQQSFFLDKVEIESKHLTSCCWQGPKFFSFLAFIKHPYVYNLVCFQGLYTHYHCVIRQLSCVNPRLHDVKSDLHRETLQLLNNMKLMQTDVYWLLCPQL